MGEHRHLPPRPRALPWRRVVHKGGYPGFLPSSQGRDPSIRAGTLSVWQNSWLDLFLPVCLSWYERDLQRGELQLAGGGLQPPALGVAVQRLTLPQRMVCGGGGGGGQGLLLGKGGCASTWSRGVLQEGTSWLSELGEVGGAQLSLPLSWQCLWHRGLAPTPEGCRLPLERDR